MSDRKEELKVENVNAVELDDDVLDMVTGGSGRVVSKISTKMGEDFDPMAPRVQE